MSKLIECVNVTKTYKNGSIYALKNINLCIHTGEFAAILGPSGSGKSTLMSILGCLDKPTSGTYLFNHHNINGFTVDQLARLRNQEIGFVFQRFHLLPNYTALENVMLPLHYANRSTADAKARALTLLTQVGLSDRTGHYPSELSGGQSQRVAIARALANDPKLILADEPTGNLDSESGEIIMQLFTTLVSRGKTLLMVTHEKRLAERTQRIISVRDGEIGSCIPDSCEV